jgi:hypothetical protein
MNHTIPAKISHSTEVQPLAFNAREVCKILGGISATTLWRIEKSHALRRVPNIKKRIFARVEVERFLAGGKAA